MGWAAFQVVAIAIAIVFVIVVAFSSAFVNCQLIFWAIDQLYAFGRRAKNAINEKMENGKRKAEKLTQIKNLIDFVMQLSIC